MRLKLVIMAVALLALVIPVAAQDSAANTITFNNFSFRYPAELGTMLTAVQFAGEPVDLEAPGGPRAPQTYFAIYNETPDPVYPEYAPNLIRVYRTGDLARYDNIQPELDQLRAILAQRPDLSAYTIVTDDPTAPPQTLPFLYGANAAQVLRARPQYVDWPGIQGISYVVAYRQDAYPFLSRDFTYTFQGITTDGLHAISATFRLETGLFPSDVGDDFDYDAFAAEMAQHFRDSVAALQNAQPGDFTPSLATLDAVIRSFTFPTIEAAAMTEPPATTDESAADPTFGGLGGVTWTLMSYGDAENPTVVLDDTLITLEFALEGISGDAGCNRYNAGFSYEGNTLSISPIAATRRACDEPIMTQEFFYLSALGAATGFQREEDTLQIFYIDLETREQDVLTFTAQ